MWICVLRFLELICVGVAIPDVAEVTEVQGVLVVIPEVL